MSPNLVFFSSLGKDLGVYTVFFGGGGEGGGFFRVFYLDPFLFSDIST